MTRPSPAAPAPFKNTAAYAVTRALPGPALACAFLAASVAQAQVGPPERIGAYEKENYPVALKQFKLLASRGMRPPNTASGFMYANGQGVPYDYLQPNKATEQESVETVSQKGMLKRTASFR